MRTQDQTTTVTVNGKEVINFVPDNNTQAAIVSLNVIRRLASLLPSGAFREIKQRMMADIDDSDSIADYVKLLEDEVDFHRTVNLLTAYQQVEVSNTEYR